MNLVLTIAMGKIYEQMADLTHETIKYYAKKIGADFLCINDQKISKTTPHWEKFQIYELLKKYDRIFYVDTDVIIRPDCPDVFKIVPREYLGMFNEAPFTDRSKELLIDTCKEYGIYLASWNGKYYNSGVMVISKEHQELFKKPEKEFFSFYEQTYINAKLAQLKISMFDLEHKFNRMSCIDQFSGEERHDSFIIHYAGFPSIERVMPVIADDLRKWNDNKNGFNYKKHIYISVSGGLGDQICAEPAVRFMRENQYPNDEFIVATHFPRIFEHLKEKGVIVCDQGRANLQNDTPYFIRQSLPGPDTMQWSLISHLLCHTVDFTSIALMKRTLPLKDRELKFIVHNQDRVRIKELTGGTNLNKAVVVHPGRHWETKTFPDSYWQEIIDLLAKKRTVIVIGKDEPGDPPDYKEGARGTVQINCGRNVIDLRNKISIGELAALLSEAKILVSNDSAPIHLAGAFDNWIVILPSCKHPDHILPYRKGGNVYKTKALYKKLIIDDIESRPTQLYETTVDVNVNDWSQYLMEPKDVVKNIINL